MARAKARIAALHQGTPEGKDVDIDRAELALRRSIARLRAIGSEFEE